MPSIRMHSKSRRGCKQCKQRKVKCDETPPVCRKCIARKESCSYESDYHPSKVVEHCAVNQTNIQLPTSRFDDVREAEREPTHVPDAIALLQRDKQPTVPITSMSIDDLEWHQYFLLETAPTLAFHPAAREVWQQEIPDLARSSPCLLYGLFAIAALHKLANLGTSMPESEQNRCRVAAVVHQHAALSEFISALNLVDEATCVPLCAFNVVFSILPFAWKALPHLQRGVTRLESSAEDEYINANRPADLPDAAIANFVENLKRWKGTDSILWQFGDKVWSTSLGVLFVHPPFSQLRPLFSGASTTLDLLQQRAVLAPSPEKKATYDCALQKLSRVARCCDEPRWHPYIMTFPTHMTAEEVILLQQKDSLMLVMLAFWSTCVHALRDRWWAKGWPADLANEVQSIVGDEWADELQWTLRTFSEERKNSLPEHTDR